MKRGRDVYATDIRNARDLIRFKTNQLATMRATRSNFRNRANGYGLNSIRAGYNSGPFSRINIRPGPRASAMEKKYFDNTIANPPPASIHCISELGQGSGENQRIGMNCWSKTILFNWVNLHHSQQPQNCRIIIFKDKYSNGILPTAAELLETETSPFLSPLNMQNKQRFVVIRDIRSQTTIRDTGDFGSVFIKHRDKMGYRAATETAGSVQTNGLFVYIFTPQATETINGLRFYSRLRFTEN